MTSPDSRRLLGLSIVPWIAKFQSSASGRPSAPVTRRTSTSRSSGWRRRLTVTGGAVTTPAPTRAGRRAASAWRTASTTPSRSASRTARSRRSTAIQPRTAESTNAPGPECVCEAESTSVAAFSPAAARRRSVSAVKARSTAIRSTVTQASRRPPVSRTSARAATASRSPSEGLNQNVCG